MKEGRELRDAGLSLVTRDREDWLACARSVAIEVAEATGQVTINDVRERIELPADFHPNTWGAVLKGNTFEPIGYCQATHPSAHARVVRVYKLKGQS
jgi:hypothetical protein